MARIGDAWGFRPTPLNPEYVLRASLLHFTGIKIAASETKKLPSFLTQDTHTHTHTHSQDTHTPDTHTHTPSQNTHTHDTHTHTHIHSQDTHSQDTHTHTHTHWLTHSPQIKGK